MCPDVLFWDSLTLLPEAWMTGVENFPQIVSDFYNKKKKIKHFIQSSEDVTPHLLGTVMDSLCKVFLSQEEL